MKVLMFGWEFPPYNSGGLGTACYGLVKSLSKKDVEVSLVLPFSHEVDFAKIIDAYKKEGFTNVNIKRLDYLLKPYITSEIYTEEIGKIKKTNTAINYSQNLFEEVKRYASRAYDISTQENFDVIHAHDWLTYEAGMIAKEATGKPLVVHVHATEFDRTGGNGVNQSVYEIEKRGMEQADMILVVSHFTKEKVVKHYGINSEKIIVVHNGVEEPSGERYHFPLKDNKKIVLFLGRITMQKGPDYFVYMSKAVSDIYPDVKFVIAGEGDMKKIMIEKAAQLGVLDKYLFTGWLRGKDAERAYQMADVFVMPSISEPFGIVPLESIINGTPVVISKQAGVCEVISSALKVNFWDIEEMANKVVAVLKYPALNQTLKENGLKEVRKITWDNVADKCAEAYQKIA